ncbi:hypothetical protein Tco_1285515 [Tanacetum coccineum]
MVGMWWHIFLELKLLHLFTACFVVLVEADAILECALAAYDGRMAVMSFNGFHEDETIRILAGRPIMVAAMADPRLAVSWRGDDDNSLFAMHNLPTSVSWLGSHTKSVIAAMAATVDTLTSGSRSVVNKPEPQLAQMSSAGQMRMTELEISNIARLKPTHSNKIIEAKVYRKWVSRNVRIRQPTGIEGLAECKASTRNLRRIQVKDIVKEVEDYLKTYSSAGMDISWYVKGIRCGIKDNQSWLYSDYHVIL